MGREREEGSQANPERRRRWRTVRDGPPPPPPPPAKGNRGTSALWIFHSLRLLLSLMDGFSRCCYPPTSSALLVLQTDPILGTRAACLTLSPVSLPHTHYTPVQNLGRGAWLVAFLLQTASFLLPSTLGIAIEARQVAGDLLNQRRATVEPPACLPAFP